MNPTRFACPCCRHLTLRERPPGTYDICPVCFWEDDPEQFVDPSCEGGANGVSLEAARANYLAFGAVSKDRLEHVRPTEGEEEPPGS